MAEVEAYDMARAREKFAAKMQAEGGATTKRKQKRRDLSDAIDGRSLRATGRTKQLNLRVTEEFRKALGEHSKSLGYATLVELIEDAVEAFVKGKSTR
jgi:hypothetical protein